MPRRHGDPATIFALMRGELLDEVGRLFTWLFLAQWVLAIALAAWVSPFAWAGNTHAIHLHVWLASCVGAALNAPILVLLRLRPRWWLTRHAVAATQMLWSALLIHVTGGRIETHFHVFVSLGVLASYRDWSLFPTATIVVGADHLVRGVLWPESVYGQANPEWWRFLEHASWVAFDDAVLVWACVRAMRAMRVEANRESQLVALTAEFEGKVEQRTAELTRANADLAEEMKTRLQMEAERRQANKLEAVGRLAAGVAHEINTPVQFVSDSLHFVRDATGDMLTLVDELRGLVDEAKKGPVAPERLAAADEAAVVADLDYLRENVPRALERSLDGLGRVATIVRSMKEFAHPDAKEKTTVDLNRAIESTLVIARNEYKYVADLETDFGDLPPVLCHIGDLNQAVLNIVVNAAHAITDVVGDSGTKRGKITVCTRCDGERVLVAITDTGGGIPEEVQPRIFDPFFTTKEVGKGTGQGLAIARSVVVDRHGGTLEFTCVPGVGTTFTLTIPVAATLEKAA